MLYDPKWEAPTKADPLSLDNLIAWLERKPAGKRYCYFDHGRCLFGQYFSDCGFRNVWVGGWSFRHSESDGDVRLPEGWDDIATDGSGEHSFGDALRRARAAAARS